MDVYVFEVTLPEIRKKVSRTIEILENQTLNELSSVILEAYGFDDDHLHAFFLSGNVWDDSTGYYDPLYEDPLNPNKKIRKDDIQIKNLNLEIGQSTAYLFDFGDEWVFNVELIDKKKGTSDLSYPIISKKIGEAPRQYIDYPDDESVTCPECGYPLSLTMDIDEKSNEMLIDCFCEGPGDDEFHMRIQTGLTHEDIDNFDRVGETRSVKMILMERKKDPHI